MSLESSSTGTFQIQLPKELLQEVARARPGEKHSLHVAGWKPSLIGRVLDIFGGNRDR